MAKAFLRNKVLMSLTDPVLGPQCETTVTNECTTLMSLEDEVDEELFNEKHLCFSNIIDIKTYSNIRKLLRVSSYVLRFIQRCRSTRKLNQRRKLHCKVESYIHLDEINKATLVWIKDIQKQTFHQELSAITIGRCLHVPTFVKQLKLYRDKNQV